MMDGFVARQPIFDIKMDVYGYELLYRENAVSSQSNVENDEDRGNMASSETIIKSFHNIGIGKLTNGKRAFVNFTEKLIIDEVATLLPADTLVIEVLEDVVPSPRILAALESLSRRGYLIALDDFVLSPEFFPLFQFTDIIKVDFLLTPMDDIRKLAGILKNKNIILLAEKIETGRDFQEAVDMGFTLFQGYFFSKPTTVHQKMVNPLSVNCLQLMKLAGKSGVSFGQFADIIKQDVSLSYSLLRLVNSAYFGLRQQVTGIKHALSILGEKELSKWIMLVSMSKMRNDKPEELVRMSMMRGRILEALAPDLGLVFQKNEMFLLGLFSLLDVLVDRPLPEILTEIQISVFIMDNLVGDGRYRKLLDMLSAYEKGSWDEAMALAGNFGLPGDRLTEEYLDALGWADTLSI